VTASEPAVLPQLRSGKLMDTQVRERLCLDRQMSARHWVRQGCSYRKRYRDLSRNDREDDHGEESEVEDQEVEEIESQESKEDEEDRCSAQEEARGGEGERPQEAGGQEGQGQAESKGEAEGAQGGSQAQGGGP
jgi:hypothetical protein